MIIRKLTAVQKAAVERNADRGIKFVLSTDQPDLTGDIVVQEGLSLSRDPLPAQIDHGGSMFDLIGEWTNIKFGTHQTTAVLKLLDAGISKAADLVRSLYESGVSLAASIGFVPDFSAYELIRDPKNDQIIGIKWLKAALTEASVIVTPANPAALAVMKSVNFQSPPRVRQSPEDSRAEVLRQLQAAAIQRSTTGTKPMNIAEMIRAVEKKLNELRDKALATAQTMQETADETARGAMVAELEATNVMVAAQEKELAVLKSTEATIAARAVAVVEPNAPQIFVPSTPRMSDKDRIRMLVRSALCTFEAYATRVPVQQVLEARYARDPLFEATRAVTMLTQHKAAQNPALTTVPEWAGALVRDGYGAFMEALKVDSVVPQLPLQSESFDGFNSITVPYRANAYPQNPNLAAAFRAEGAPIRVGAVQLTSKKLTPKSMGVIGTFTMELYRRSTPNIEAKIHDWILEDTAIALDTIFLGNAVGTPEQPAGIQAGIAAHDTAASTGNTAAQITADLRGRLQEMASHGLGKNPVWIMHPSRRWGLQLTLTAAGTPLFPELAQGQLLGIPVVTSITVPLNTVFLVDAAYVTFAGGTPEFLGTEVATIHEEDTTPLPIVGGGGTPATASPVRSLYQTNSAALRAIWEVDWMVLRIGAVQTITAVNW